MDNVQNCDDHSTKGLSLTPLVQLTHLRLVGHSTKGLTPLVQLTHQGLVQ
jgi:hypothetical protein